MTEDFGSLLDRLWPPIVCGICGKPTDRAPGVIFLEDGTTVLVGNCCYHQRPRMSQGIVYVE